MAVDTAPISRALVEHIVREAVAKRQPEPRIPGPGTRGRSRRWAAAPMGTTRSTAEGPVVEMG